jgi:hypothetical protein
MFCTTLPVPRIYVVEQREYIFGNFHPFFFIKPGVLFEQCISSFFDLNVSSEFFNL